MNEIGNFAQDLLFPKSYVDDQLVGWQVRIIPAGMQFIKRTQQAMTVIIISV